MKYIIIFISVFFFYSCSPSLEPVEIPDYSKELEGITKLDTSTIIPIEGVYLLKKGKSEFGEKAVIKVIKNKIVIFFEANISYSISDFGKKNDNISIVGYWRKAINSQTDLISLSIDSLNSYKLLNKKIPDSIKISGKFYMDGSERKIELVYLKGLNNTEKYIIAHRGGGRNQDRLPASENSIEMIKYSELLGTNSIEIDVRLTKDSIPVLFHDEYLNKRLVIEDYLLGKVSDYSYKQLRSFCTLKNGGKIPSLEDALDVVLNETDLKLVWLDIKSTEALKIIAPIQKKYIKLAKEKGRNLEIVLGLSSIELLNSYKKLENFCDFPCLIEIDQTEIDIDCYKYWAPRWTLGINNQTNDFIHTKGKKSFVWTLDVPEYIKTYVKESKFDGILTNYPSQVAFEYYSKDK